jgi:Tir chaperone protein (CesT) family
VSIAAVGSWLRAFGVDDFAGHCTLTYRESIDFTVDVISEESFVCFSALLAELSEDPEPELLRHLLQLNHLGIGTDGSCLSLDETGLNVVLWYQCPVAGLDAESFANLVGAFLDQAEHLRESVIEGATATQRLPADRSRQLV